MSNTENRASAARARAAPGGIAAALAAFAGRVAAYLRAYAKARAEARRARESVLHLMSLSNRELKDMGIGRSEIVSMVYGGRGERHLDAGGER